MQHFRDYERKQPMKAPAFQFYPDDFMGGTADMTQAEVGAYILLLCRQWATGEIPADYDRLKLIAKGEVSDHVLAKFPNGKNARMEKVRAGLEEFRKSKSESGKIGADKRWERMAKNGTPIVSPMANAWQTHGTPIILPMANTMANDSSPSPSPSLNTVLHNTNGLRPVAFNGKLTPEQTEVANRLQLMLGEQWNDANGRKWLKRCRDERLKAERVVAEVEQASREVRINTTPAQYAEQIWKEFA